MAFGTGGDPPVRSFTCAPQFLALRTHYYKNGKGCHHEEHEEHEDWAQMPKIGEEVQLVRIYSKPLRPSTFCFLSS